MLLILVVVNFLDFLSLPTASACATASGTYGSSKHWAVLSTLARPSKVSPVVHLHHGLLLSLCPGRLRGRVWRRPLRLSVVPWDHEWNDWSKGNFDIGVVHLLFFMSSK